MTARAVCIFKDLSKGQSAALSSALPASTGQSAENLHSGPRRGQAQGPWARVECSECHRYSRMGGGCVGMTFSGHPPPRTRSDGNWTRASSGRRRAASAICSLTFLVALPLLCPFRFPMKACPTGKIPSPITASRESQLWFCGLPGPPPALAVVVGTVVVGITPSWPAVASAPEASGEPCPGLFHMGFSQNPWTASST